MKKGRIINFEWMCDYNHYTAEQFDYIKTTLIKKDILQAAQDGCNIIVGLYLLDGFLQPKARYYEFIQHLNEIKTFAAANGIEKIYLISGHGEQIDECPFDYFFLDFNLRMLLNSYPDHDRLSKFDTTNSKFLFLTGMPNRPNRIGLLSKYYDADMLKNAEWSFFAPWTTVDQQWCRDHLKRYSDDEYQLFLKECERSFDNRFESAKPYYGSYTSGDTDVVWHDVVDTEWVRSPTHIDSSVYESTLFSIVSEGPNYWKDDNDFITEKSWRTFLHRHPFIFAGHPDQFKYLKKLGFRTFEEYLLIKDYAYIEDENLRLDAVVANTEYWLENLKDCKSELLDDIEYNYNRFFYHIDQQNKLCTHLQKDLNVPEHEIDFYLGSTGYRNLIRRIPNGF